jgi:hypothetical protein
LEAAIFLGISARRVEDTAQSPRGENVPMVDDMIREWYWLRGDRVEGPLTLQDLRRMLEGGTLNPADMVRRGEAGAWVAVRSVAEPLDDRLQPPPAPAPALDVTRDREPKVTLDTPFAEWGVAALVAGSALLILTPLTVQTVYVMSQAGGSRFLSFLLTIVLEFLLFAGNAGSMTCGVLGMIGYIKKRQRLPLNLAGATVSALSLLLWMVTAVILLRSMDRLFQ